MTGRICQDPEMRMTNSGKQVVSFSIAVQKRIKPQDGGADADFFKVTAWGNQAQFVSNYITKGRLIAVDGRLETRKWQDQNGGNRESVEIVAENVQSLDRGDQQVKPATSPTDQEGGYDPFADED